MIHKVCNKFAMKPNRLAKLVQRSKFVSNLGSLWLNCTDFVSQRKEIIRYLIQKEYLRGETSIKWLPKTFFLKRWALLLFCDSTENLLTKERPWSRLKRSSNRKDSWKRCLLVAPCYKWESSQCFFYIKQCSAGQAHTRFSLDQSKQSFYKIHHQEIYPLFFRKQSVFSLRWKRLVVLFGDLYISWGYDMFRTFVWFSDLSDCRQEPFSVKTLNKNGSTGYEWWSWLQHILQSCVSWIEAVWNWESWGWDAESQKHCKGCAINITSGSIQAISPFIKTCIEQDSSAAIL